MTVATTNGDRTWVFRYSSARKTRTLYYSIDVQALRETHPDLPALGSLSDETRIIVSEPVGGLPGMWNEVPESSYVIIQEGQDELHQFRPQEYGPPSR